MAISSKTIKTMGFVMLATFLAKVLGFLRTVFLAREFGTGLEVGAYLVAYRIPDLIFTTIGAALSTVFIPIIAEYMSHEDREGANEFANNILTLLLLFSAAISVLGIMLAPQIVGFMAADFPESARTLAIDLSRVLFPVLIFMTLSFTAVGILQSHGEFNVPAIISILSNAVMIVYLLFFSRKFGVHGLAYSALLGWALQFAVQVPSLFKNRYRYFWICRLNHPGVRKFGKLVVPVILGTSVQSINIFVNLKFASSLNSGQAVAAIEYANQLYIVIVGVFTLTITQIMFQALSKYHSKGDADNFRSSFNQTLKLIFLGLFPILAMIVALRIPIIQVLYERGSFGRTSTILTSTALLFYSLGAVSFGVQELANRTFFSMHNTLTPAILAAISMGINIILSFILVKLMGIAGLALAASLSSIMLSIMLLLKLQKVKRGLMDRGLISAFIKTCLCAVPAGVISFLLFEYTSNITGSTGTIGIFISLLTAAAAGVITYILFCFILKVEEVKLLLAAIRGRKSTI